MVGGSRGCPQAQQPLWPWGSLASPRSPTLPHGPRSPHLVPALGLGLPLTQFTAGTLRLTVDTGPGVSSDP